MDNGIYVALSRQMALFRDMDVTANNLANVNTTGYTGEKMLFTDYLVDDGNRHKIAFTQDIATYRVLDQGPLQATGNPLDMAISGPGYFQIETPLGTRYTKAGKFTMNHEGTLTTIEGYPVLDASGQQIQFDDTDRDIQVGENGQITVATLEGALEERGQVGIVEFEDEQKLERLNSTMFRTDMAPLPQQTSRVLQGTLEQSNVSPIQELVRLTKLSRSTSSTAKYVEVMYDLQRKANNTYARAQQT